MTSEHQRYRDEPPVRFWHARDFATVQDIFEHVAAGGVRVIAAPTSAPEEFGEADAGLRGVGLRSV